MAQPTQERLAAQLEKPQQTPGNVGHAGSGTGPENTPHFQDHEDDHVHHVEMKTYYVIFALLMVLLFITVGAWYIDQHYFPLGAFSTPIAMAIAIAKAVAIVLFFMHVKFASKLVKIFACTGLAFVFIMFLLTFNDYGTREWLPKSGVYNDKTTSNSLGEGGESSGTIIRAATVGMAPNDQSTPSDNVETNAPGNATQTAIDSGRGRGARVTRPSVLGADVRVVPDVSGATTGGATSMTSAMNSNGTMSEGQSPQSAGVNAGSATTTGNEQTGSSGASGMASGREDTATNGSATNPGPIVGGAANNVFGSAVQSRGIEPGRTPVTR